MTTAQIAATFPLVSLLAYHSLKAAYSWLHRLYTNRRIQQDLCG